MSTTLTPKWFHSGLINLYIVCKIKLSQYIYLMYNPLNNLSIFLNSYCKKMCKWRRPLESSSDGNGSRWSVHTTRMYLKWRKMWLKCIKAIFTHSPSIFRGLEVRQLPDSHLVDVQWNSRCKSKIGVDAKWSRPSLGWKTKINQGQQKHKEPNKQCTKQIGTFLNWRNPLASSAEHRKAWRNHGSNHRPTG